MQDIDRLAALSQTYGSDADYVLLGGGNTSFKTGDTLYIKPSGTRLAAIRPDQFIGLDRAAVRKVFTAGVPEEPMQREAAVKHIMAGSVRPLGSGRPSVEAPLHEVIESRFVFHLHPALVNGMTCALDGEAVCRRLFPDALWVEFVDPGYTLSTVVADRLAPFAPGEQPAVIFLQNHGVFVGADTTDEIEAIYKRIMDTLRDAYRAAGVDMTLQRGTVDSAAVQALAPRLRSWLGDGADRVAVTSMAPFRVAAGPLTPDHIVYAKSFALEGELTAAAVQEFEALRGYTPRVVSTPDTAVFAAGSSLKDARGAAALAEDGALVQQLCDAFGGPRYLDNRAR